MNIDHVHKAHCRYMSAERRGEEKKECSKREGKENRGENLWPCRSSISDRENIYISLSLYFSILPELKPSRKGLKQTASFNPGGCVALNIFIQSSSSWRRPLFQSPPLGLGWMRSKIKNLIRGKIPRWIKVVCLPRGKSGLQTCILLICQ